MLSSPPRWSAQVNQADVRFKSAPPPPSRRTPQFAWCPPSRTGGPDRQINAEAAGHQRVRYADHQPVGVVDLAPDLVYHLERRLQRVRDDLVEGRVAGRGSREVEHNWRAVAVNPLKARVVDGLEFGEIDGRG